MKEAVLAILEKNRGRFVSGQAISRELKVSRAAVWKAVKALQEEGFTIEAVTRSGYRLTDGPEILSPAAVLPLVEQAERDQLICLKSIDSTNTYAKTLPPADGRRIYVTAEEQTGGRGRRGRSFYSPAGLGLYLTGLYRPDPAPAFPSNFTAYVAVAVCLAIEKTCGLRPAIKWPNDILAGGKKLCGILTELAFEGESGAVQYLITGIGINVGQTEADFPEEIRSLATSLILAGAKAPSRIRLCAALINELDKAYEAFLSGDAAYRELYRARCATLGQSIFLLSGPQKTPAFAEALAEDFGLIVRYEDGSRAVVYAGDVSVRS